MMTLGASFFFGWFHRPGALQSRDFPEGILIFPVVDPISKVSTPSFWWWISHPPSEKPQNPKSDMSSVLRSTPVGWWVRGDEILPFISWGILTIQESPGVSSPSGGDVKDLSIIAFGATWHKSHWKLTGHATRNVCFILGKWLNDKTMDLV